MLNRPPFWLAVVAAAAVGLSACGGGSGKTVTGTSSTSTTLTTTSASPSSTPTKIATVSPTTGPRKVAEIKSALLELNDLPSGYAIEPASAGGADGSVSSKDKACAPLVKLTNVKTAPGSMSSASVAFSGGQGGPFVDESVDSMGSAASVQALQASFKSAVAACQKLIITIPGQGTSTVQIAQVSAPKFGEHTFAARMTATGGALRGLEITQVVAGVKDVLLSITYLGAQPEDVDGATEAAVTKAVTVLGGAKTGA